jgi:hypothetical protein
MKAKMAQAEYLAKRRQQKAAKAQWQHQRRLISEAG